MGAHEPPHAAPPAGRAGPSRLRGLVPALLVAGSVTLALLIGEALLCVANYHYSPLRIAVDGRTHDWRFHHAFEDAHFEFDPVRIWRPRAGHSVFNAHGYRGRPIGDADASTVRILAVGDSNTLGWAGPRGAHWPRYLEDELRRAGHAVLVINAGAWGYSSYQGLKHFETMLAFEPDLVLVSFGANDAHRVHASDRDYVAAAAGSLRPYLYPFKVGQFLVATWDHAVADVPREGSARVSRVSPEEYAANLTRIVEQAQVHGATAVLLTRPFTGESPTPTWWKNFGPEYVDITVRLGRELDVPVIDLHRSFAGRDQFFEDESHFTESGHRRAGALIAESLVALPATPLATRAR